MLIVDVYPLVFSVFCLIKIHSFKLAKTQVTTGLELTAAFPNDFLALYKMLLF